MNPKLLFVLVVLLVALSVVFLVMGPARDDNARTRLVPAWADSVGVPLKRPLTPRDVGEPARCGRLWDEDGLELANGERCLLFAAKLEGLLPRIRVCTVRLEGQGEAIVRLVPVSETQLEIEETLGPGAPAVDLQVDPSGGTLEIVCRSDPGCRLAVR